MRWASPRQVQTLDMSNKPLVSKEPSTKPSTIRSVAPDGPEGDKYHANHFNTIAVTPDYKISISLGDMDALFKHAASTKEGQKERLQVLGMFYRPLGYPEADDCHTVAWKHYKEEISSPALKQESKAHDQLEEDVQNDLIWVSKNGKWDKGRLPEEGEFAKIRLPGGYTFSSMRNDPITEPHYDNTFGFGCNRWKLEREFYKRNQALGKVPLEIHVERKIGKGDFEDAPGVAVYFQLITPDDLPAYDDTKKPECQITAPPLRESKMGNKTITNPKVKTGAGPRAYMKKRREYQLDQTTEPENKDPQVDNAHALMGGKREMKKDGPNPVICGLDPDFDKDLEEVEKRRAIYTKNLSELDSKKPGRVAHYKRMGSDDTEADQKAQDWVDSQKKSTQAGLEKCDDDSISHSRENLVPDQKIKGFHIAHDGRALKGKPLEPAQGVEPEGQKFKNCVRVMTNEEGKAGILFQPSRVGGDRYKFRIFLGPSTLASDGTAPDAVKIETGTFVVWRNIRLSRYIRHKGPQSGQQLSPTITQEMKKWGLFGKSAKKLVKLSRSDGGLSEIDFGDMGTAHAPYEGPALQYAKAYCEFIVERKARSPEEFTSIKTEWMAALKATIDKIKEVKAADPTRVPFNVDALFKFDEADVMKSPFTINMHTPKAHNADPNTADSEKFTLKKHHASKEDREKVQKVFSQIVVATFVGHLSKGGNLPGMTVVQGAEGCIWQTLGETPKSDFSTSGVATRMRGCYLWYSDKTYDNNFIYSRTSNTCHEMGHCLTILHAPGGTEVKNDSSAHHDLDDVCVMSYLKCEGQHCGRCMGAINGFHTFAAKFKDPV